jgi:hypothetical protein
VSNGTIFFNAETRRDAEKRGGKIETERGGAHPCLVLNSLRPSASLRVSALKKQVRIFARAIAALALCVFTLGANAQEEEPSPAASASPGP